MCPVRAILAQAAPDADLSAEPGCSHSGNSNAVGVDVDMVGTVQALRQVLDSLPDLVLIVDRESQVLFANRGFRGFVATEPEGRPLSELLPASTYLAVQAVMQRVLATGRSAGHATEIADSQRRTHHFDIKASVIRQNGRIAGLIVRATDTTERVRAERADVSERKQLERAVLQAVNREQYRIGNDLHDGLGQELTGIALMLRGLAGRMASEYPPLLPEIEGITRLVSNAIESTRALARGLSPVNLERGGLVDALQSLARHASELYGVPTVFTHRLQGHRPLNPELANHLYRIAQEAVRNAVQHGGAQSIKLHLSVVRTKVRLSITDDGRGLPPQAMEAAGMGLKIMRYRARMLGGEVRFEPVEPRGARVVCECPFEAADGDGRSAQTPKRGPRMPRPGAS